MKSYQISHLIVLALCLAVNFFAPKASANDEEGPVQDSAQEARQVVSRTQAMQTDDKTDELGLDDYEAVARIIIEVQKSMSDEYAVGDGLTLSAYILKTFSEIGDYELQRDEILELVDVFERLTDIETAQEVKDIILGLDKLVFSKRNDRLSVVFHTQDSKGFRLKIFKENEAPEEESLEIEHFQIYDRAKISFTPIEGHVQREELINFLKEDFKLPLLPAKWFSMLNQVHPDAKRFIGPYLQQKREATPLKLVMEGFELRVVTSTLFNRIDFEIKEAFATPGLVSHEMMEKSDGEKSYVPLPSFHLWMQEKLLKVKASVLD